MHHPGEHTALPLVNGVHPNNTNTKKTNLNNVNRASRKEVVENSRREIKINLSTVVFDTDFDISSTARAAALISYFAKDRSFSVQLSRSFLVFLELE